LPSSRAANVLNLHGLGFTLTAAGTAAGDGDRDHLPEFGLIQDPYLQIEDFMRAVTTGATPRVGADDGLYALTVARTDRRRAAGV